jgi:hypothetical protein
MRVLAVSSVVDGARWRGTWNRLGLSRKAWACGRALLVSCGVLTLTACTMQDLPRNMDLKAFEPHRKDFVCKHEADVVPPIDAEAERWHQEAMANIISKRGIKIE